MQNISIDVTFDFTSDTPEYWDNFWENNQGLGGGGNDPDIMSETLQRYHQALWSRPLPNGRVMNLSKGAGSAYLTWDEFRFGSDSITASFRYRKYRWMLELLEKEMVDYKGFMEFFVHKTYTIGGSIIFPKHIGSINQSRGCNPFIKDRWDLTLECIRRYYVNETSPLSDVLVKDKGFFDLFESFKGYVDYFFLQDCVTEDYGAVVLWLDCNLGVDDPLPQTVSDYKKWMHSQLDFVEKRNQRIHNFLQTSTPS